MPRLLLSLLLLLTLTGAPMFGQSAVMAEDTITLRLMRMQASKAQKAAAETGAVMADYTVTISGQPFNFKTLTLDGYAEDFKRTGGRVLRAGGINLSFLMDYNHPVFLVFNGLLVLILGFYWISKVNEVSKGKGGLDIIPLLGKLAVGLIVMYNIPFVYAIAMSLKDLGIRVVTYAIADGTDSGGQPVVSAAIQNLGYASLAPLQNGQTRDEAIKSAVFSNITQPGNMPNIGYIPETKDGKPESEAQIAKNSGRTRLATLVADLNKKILHFQQNAKIATISRNTDSSLTVIPVALSTNEQKRGSLDLVGFSPSQESINLQIASMAITDEDIVANQERTFTRADATSYDAVLSKLANNVATAERLRDLYLPRLLDYMRIMSQSYTTIDEIKTASNFSNASIFYQYTPNYQSKYTGTLLPLGSMLLGQEEQRNFVGPLPADARTYKDTVHDAVGLYMNRYLLAGNTGLALPFAKTNPDQLGGDYSQNGTASPSWWARNIGNLGDGFTEALTEIYNYIVNIPKKIAELAIDLARWAWAPLLTGIADFFFNIAIEAYAYILFIAYPFWFYEKTKKAFTGALNTLISMSLTAATFSLLTIFFESFIGAILRTLDLSSQDPSAGVSAAGLGTMAAATVVAIKAAPLTAGILAAIGIGAAVFYIVGTFLCFRLTPQIFKAFLEGSSVITPMLTAAATAVLSGAAAGVMGGLGAGGLAAAGAKALAGSATGKAIREGAKAWTTESKVGRATSALARPFTAASNRVKAGAKWASTHTALGRDVSAAAKGISSRVGAFAKDPVSGLVRLAQSSAGQVAVAAAAGFSGDPGAALKSLGGIALVSRLVEKNSEPSRTTAPGAGSKSEVTYKPDPNAKVRIDGAGINNNTLTEVKPGFYSGFEGAGSAGSGSSSSGSTPGPSRRRTGMNPPP